MCGCSDLFTNLCDRLQQTKTSLQQLCTNQILIPAEIFEFCQEHLKGMTFTYIKDEEIIQHHNNKLLDRFENSVAITGTRSFHCLVPVSESNLKCFIASQATEYETHSTIKAVQITLHTRDSIACVYDGQWWLAGVNDSDMNKDVLVTFYHPRRTKDSF
ncbi:hypothetical protein AVEN_193651-1 [Araneus ventricosus]|uniref:Uncharacterized protein n=1 Tax=Araneus ventricosus TaxID=182803 RepID=A0A4Y1ZP42_ARAVE|nr:hypothetical protein AVEN_216716-1 [Araneus ventricosus]GBL61045.1 hypothetical protein AVEN_193651-1 [Araneus ventricosus]